WREKDLDETATKICQALEDRAYQVDDLSDKIGVNTSQLLVALLQLEMEGIVLQKAGKNFQLL
ncbi:MAG TPA: DNA-protecting protein DprA, partial [Balneolaceae bacterium]|nr:DNA-protecting protein DprA [Balneolaceae bacterium]